MKDVVYVTSNEEKAHNFSRQMGVQIPHRSLDVNEIQSLDHHAVAGHKARQAFDKIGIPVVVEDVGLAFEAWHKLPGPFIKYFVKTAEHLDDSVANLCKMLDGFETRKATASCTFAYFDGNELAFFDGSLVGIITPMPRGTGGFGFDRIFQPDGFDGKTGAELDDSEYDIYYATIKPFDQLRAFLEQSDE